MITREQMTSIESQLRSQLSEVRLVAELDLSVAGETFLSAYGVLVHHLKANVPKNGLTVIDELHKTFPACTVVSITGLGVLKGGADQFWNQVDDPDGIATVQALRVPYLSQLNSSRFGKSYLRSLDELGLPNFSHIQNSQKNLTPILLHGGIPAKDVPDVWNQIKRAVSEGRENGLEVVAAWRQDETIIRYLNKPPKRFIKETGRFAEDLVQRMLLALFDAATSDDPDVHSLARTHRLPPVYIEKLKNVGTADVRRRQQIPNPTIRLSNYSGEGPLLRLPPVRIEGESGSWEVTSVNTRRVVASRREDAELAVLPAPRWTCELLVGKSRVKYREFQGVGRLMVWAFKPSGDEFQLADFDGTFEDEKSWLLAHKDSRILANVSGALKPASRVEDFRFGGEWTEYALFELELSGASEVQISAEERDEAFQVVRGQARPLLQGTTPSGVRDSHGRVVYTDSPKLVFTRALEKLEGFVVVLQSPAGRVVEKPLQAFEGQNQQFQLLANESDSPGEYTVRILGPLGSDMPPTSFVYLPQCRLEGLDRLYGPADTARGTLKCLGSAEVPVSIGPSESQQEVTLYLAGRPTQLIVHIRRTAFAISEPGSLPRYDSEPVRCTRAEFLDTTLSKSSSTLCVKLGYEGPYEIGWSREYSISERRRRTAHGPLGRDDFPLRVLRDDVRSTHLPNIRLFVYVPNLEPILILEISEPPESTISSTFLRDASEGKATKLEIATDESLSGIEGSIRVRNLDEPWRPIQTVEIPFRTGITKYVVEFPKELVPGQHQIEIATTSEGAERIVGRVTRALGTAAERSAYHSKLGNSGLDQVVKTLQLGRKPLAVSQTDFLQGVANIGAYLLRHGGNTIDPRISAASEYLFSDGNEAACLDWFSERLVDSSTQESAERLLLQLVPFVATVLRGAAVMLPKEGLARLWRASVVLGAIVTVGLKADEFVELERERRYWVGDEVDFVSGFCRVVSDSGEKQIDSGPAQAGSHNVLGQPFLRAALVEILESLPKSENQLVVVLRDFDVASRNCYESVPGSRSTFPVPANLGTLPKEYLTREPAKRLVRYINNIHGLAKVMTDVNVDYGKSTRAAELLVSQYQSSRLMIQRAVIKAVEPATQ